MEISRLVLLGRTIVYAVLEGSIFIAQRCEGDWATHHILALNSAKIDYLCLAQAGECGLTQEP